MSGKLDVSIVMVCPQARTQESSESAAERLAEQLAREAAREDQKPSLQRALVAEWIHFTLSGIILPTLKLKVYTFWGLMNSATKERSSSAGRRYSYSNFAGPCSLHVASCLLPSCCARR